MKLQFPKKDYIKFYTAAVYLNIDLATYDITHKPALFWVYMQDTQGEVEYSHSPLLKYTVLMSGRVLRMASRTPGSKLDVGMELEKRRRRKRKGGEEEKTDLWSWTLMPQTQCTYLCWGKIARQRGTAKTKLKHNNIKL